MIFHWGIVVAVVVTCCCFGRVFVVEYFGWLVLVSWHWICFVFSLLWFTQLTVLKFGSQFVDTYCILHKKGNLCSNLMYSRSPILMFPDSEILACWCLGDQESVVQTIS